MKRKIIWVIGIALLILSEFAYPILLVDAQEREPITPDNAAYVTQVAMLEGQNREGSVNSVAWHPEGQILASGTQNGKVRLWNIHTAEMFAELDADIGFVNSVTFSPDGAILAAGGGQYNPDERGVQLWDVETLAPLLRLEDFSDTVFSVAFSPDNATLATGYGNAWGFGPGGVKLWDVATGELLAEYGLPNEYISTIMGTVYNVAFSPDGMLLAAANGEGRIQLWDMAADVEYAVLSGCEGWLSSVAFSPDGTLLASAGSTDYSDSGTGDVRLWDVATGDAIASLEGLTSVVRAVVFSPDGAVIASGGFDGVVRLWETATGESLAVTGDGVDVVSSLAFSPDGTLIAVGRWDSTVRLLGVSLPMPPIIDQRE